MYFLSHDIQFLHDVGGDLRDGPPCVLCKTTALDLSLNISKGSIVTNVLLGGVLGAHAEPDDEPLVDGGRHHVELARGVDRRQQLLVQLVRARETEADEANKKTQTDEFWAEETSHEVCTDALVKETEKHLGLPLPK